MKDNINFEIEHKYDIESDAIFINVKKKYKYSTSIELNDNIILDFDKDRNPCGLEILNTSSVLGVHRSNLENIKEIQIEVKIDEKSISLSVCFGLVIGSHEKSVKVSPFTANSIEVPTLQTKLASAF